MKLRFGRNGLPEAPWELQDEVELWARESGRTAKLHFIPTQMQNNRVVSGTWLARVSLKPNDPRMLLFQQGKASEPPTEDIWFHVPNEHEGRVITGAFGQREGPYRPLDILEMGASGVREFLERGNTWSGRGQYTSLEEQVKKVRESNAVGKERFRAQQKEANRLEQREQRRHRLNIPILPVGINLKQESTS